MKRILPKSFVVLLVLFAARTLIACCDCPPERTLYFSYLDARGQILDNTGLAAVVTEADSLSKKAYGFRVKFTLDRLLSAARRNSGLFTAAYAMNCRCVDESWLAKQEISRITIVTTNDFDANHSAGSDVTELFKILVGARYQDIDDYVQTSAPPEYSTPPEQPLDFFLLAEPAENGVQAFTVSVSLTDGRTLDISTTPVTLY